MKHTTAAVRATLASIDATLRLTDKPLWQDPEFLEWEAGQVSAKPHFATEHNGLLLYRYAPGPDHWLNSAEARDAHLSIDCTVYAAPMVTVHIDYICESTGVSEWDGAMRVAAADYPDTVTHGPLLLGPEPEVVSTAEHATLRDGHTACGLNVWDGSIRSSSCLATVTCDECHLLVGEDPGDDLFDVDPEPIRRVNA